MATVVHPSGMESDDSPMRKRILIGVAVVTLLALIGWGVSHIKPGSGHAGPKRQTVKITLPDTPPPPPPKQEEKKPEPKEDNKPTQQMEQKPIEAAPQPAQSLKMEGAAGDGPSAFSSGNVSKDYTNGPTSTVSARDGTNSDRAKYQFYVTSMKQLLKDALERNLQTDARSVTVTFSLWVDSDGRIKKFELAPVGNEQTDKDVRSAFDHAARDAKLPAPSADMAQPLQLRMTLLPPAS